MSGYKIKRNVTYMMKQMRERGFTLIELLVVIAIIGILAAVVLASLNDARNSGSDASIKESLTSFRSQAELIYNNNSFSYATVCTGTGSTSTAQLRTAIDNNNGTGVLTCVASQTAWGATSPLVSDASKYWCVDSTGFSGQVATSALSASDFACN